MSFFASCLFIFWFHTQHWNCSCLIILFFFFFLSLLFITLSKLVITFFPRGRYFFLLFFKFYLFIFFLLYNIVLVLPYINMHPPQMYTCSHSEPHHHHLPPHTILPGHPSAPAPSLLHSASNLDWQFTSHTILYMSQWHSPKSSPPSLSHRVQKTALHICVSSAVLHTGLSLPFF